MYIWTLRAKVSLLDLSGSVSFLSTARYLKEVQILTPPQCFKKLCQNFHAKAFLSEVDVPRDVFCKLKLPQRKLPKGKKTRTKKKSMQNEPYL